LCAGCADHCTANRASHNPGWTSSYSTYSTAKHPCRSSSNAAVREAPCYETAGSPEQTTEYRAWHGGFRPSKSAYESAANGTLHQSAAEPVHCTIPIPKTKGIRNTNRISIYICV
jgi:hypothetical protein